MRRGDKVFKVPKDYKDYKEDKEDKDDKDDKDDRDDRDNVASLNSLTRQNRLNSTLAHQGPSILREGYIGIRTYRDIEIEGIQQELLRILRSRPAVHTQ